MNEKSLTLPELYAKGKENLDIMGYKRVFPPDSNTGASIQVNRKYLDSLFFRPKFLDPVDVDTSLILFGVKLKTPVFCSPLSGLGNISEATLTDIAIGLKNVGSLIMLEGLRKDICKLFRK